MNLPLLKLLVLCVGIGFGSLFFTHAHALARDAAFAEMAFAGQCQDLIGRLQTVHEINERNRLLQALGYCADQKALDFLSRVLQRRHVNDDYLGALAGLKISLSRTEQPLNDPQLVDQLLNNRNHPQVGDSIARLLSSRQLRLNASQLKVMTEDLIAEGSPEYFLVVPLDDPQLIALVFADTTSDSPYRQKFFDRLAEESSVSLSLEWLTAIHKYGPQQSRISSEWVSWLRYLRRMKPRGAPPSSSIWQLATSHSSAWVRREALKTWFVLDPMKIKNKLAAIQRAIGDGTKMDRQTALVMLAQFGGSSKDADRILNQVILSESESVRLTLLKALKKRSEWDGQFNWTCLLLLSNGTPAEAVLALDILTLSKYPEINQALTFAFQRFRGQIYQQTRTEILQKMAATSGSSFLLMFHQASNDVDPQIAALGWRYYQHFSGQSSALAPAKTKIASPEPGTMSKNSEAIPVTYPAKPPSYFEHQVLVIETTKGLMRLRFADSFARQSSPFATLIAAIDRGEFAKQPFHRNPWRQLALKWPTKMLADAFVEAQETPDLTDLHQGLVIWDLNESEGCHWLRQDDWGRPGRYVVIGEVITGLEVLKLLDDDDTITKISTERVVTLKKKQPQF